MLPHFCKFVTSCLEIGVEDFKDSWIKRLYRNRIESKSRGRGKGCIVANPHKLGNISHWVHGSLAHWVTTSNPLDRHPKPRPTGFAGALGCDHWCMVTVTHWGALIWGEGVGPSESWSRLRRHHKTREIFLQLKNPLGALPPRCTVLIPVIASVSL